MNILEAAKISKKIRRAGWDSGAILELGEAFAPLSAGITTYELLADDWEPVVEKITITKAELFNAMSIMFYGWKKDERPLKSMDNVHWYDLKDEYGQHVANQLGFKE